MKVEQIHAIIKEIAPNVDVSKIDPDTGLRHYGVDSMDFFGIIVELQDLLGKDIPDEDIDQLRTVSSIQKYLEENGL